MSEKSKLKCPTKLLIYLDTSNHDTYIMTYRSGLAKNNKFNIFLGSTYKSRGRQEGHQMVATKEDPRAIPARGRLHSLTIERGSV